MGVTTKPTKCLIGNTKCHYLGHVVDIGLEGRRSLSDSFTTISTIQKGKYCDHSLVSLDTTGVLTQNFQH